MDTFLRVDFTHTRRCSVKRKKCSQEFKEEAVKLVTEQGYQVSVNGKSDFMSKGQP